MGGELSPVGLHSYTCRPCLVPLVVTSPPSSPPSPPPTDKYSPGDALAEELARRLGRERCWRVRWPLNQEDHAYAAEMAGVSHLRQDGSGNGAAEGTAAEADALLEGLEPDLPDGSSGEDAEAAALAAAVGGPEALQLLVQPAWYRKDANEVRGQGAAGVWWQRASCARKSFEEQFGGDSCKQAWAQQCHAWWQRQPARPSLTTCCTSSPIRLCPGADEGWCAHATRLPGECGALPHPRPAAVRLRWIGGWVEWTASSPGVRQLGGGEWAS